MSQVLRSQLELSQVKQEIERRIKEKEEEFDQIRKGHQKAMDGMQQALEQETRAKAEAHRQGSDRLITTSEKKKKTFLLGFRMKKKLEADIHELEIALENANAANAEAQRTMKRYQCQIKEAQGMTLINCNILQGITV